MLNRIIIWGATLAVALATAVSALAEDVIKLKNGQTWTGQIISEEGGFITLEVGSGSLKKKIKIWSDDVESIQRDEEADVNAGESTDAEAEETTADMDAAADSTETEAAEALDPDTKKLFVIPLKGMVGKEFRQEEIEESIDAAREYDPDIVILLIDSGGGSLAELYEISDYLIKARDEFRIVSWIKSAISAAAMTAINTREIYFQRKGHMGAATAFRQTASGAVSMQGAELEQWLARGARMGKSAGYHESWVRAIIDREQACSATREVLPNGEISITWYADETSGKEVVNPKGEVLTLQASDALKWRISLGTADTMDELAPLLGAPKWTEISSAGRTIMEDWWNLNERADKEVNRLWREFQTASGSPRMVLSTQARILKELINWANRLGDAGLFYGLYKPDLERQLREVQRRLKELGDG